MVSHTHFSHQRALILPDTHSPPPPFLGWWQKLHHIYAENVMNTQKCIYSKQSIKNWQYMQYSNDKIKYNRHAKCSSCKCCALITALFIMAGGMLPWKQCLCLIFGVHRTQLSDQKMLLLVTRIVSKHHFMK